jgi:hypothetical protein
MSTATTLIPTPCQDIWAPPAEQTLRLGRTGGAIGVRRVSFFESSVRALGVVGEMLAGLL